MAEPRDEEHDEKSRSSETELDDNHDTLWGFVSSKLGAQTRHRDQEEESSFAVVSRASSPWPVEFRPIRTPSPSPLRLIWPSTLPWLRFQVLYLKKTGLRPPHKAIDLEGPTVLPRTLGSQECGLQEHGKAHSATVGLTTTALVTAMGSRAVANMATNAATVDRAAAEIAKSVPEAYEGQHAAGLQVMLSGDEKEAKLAAFTMLVYQVSNSLVDYDDDEDNDNKYERIITLFRDIGLPRSTWKEHFARKHDRSSTAFAEKLFETAVNAGDLEVLEALLDSGVDPNQPIMSFMNCFFERPIQVAADNRVRNVDMAKLLIKAGAAVDLTTTDNCKPAIHNAAQRGTLEMVQLLVESGADIYQGHKDGDYTWNTCRTPLSYAADTWLNNPDEPSRSALGSPDESHGSENEWEGAKILRYLAGLHRKSASSVRDQQLIQDALVTAAAKSDPSLVQVLHEAGGDMAKANKQGITPLVVASCDWNGDTRVVSYLLEH
ncbi:ankyrin, partial [Coniochaeta sp. PMI_546]